MLLALAAAVVLLVSQLQVAEPQIRSRSCERRRCTFSELRASPVCRNGLEYSSQCKAKCARGASSKSIAPGPCPTPKTDCNCPAVYKRVCGDGRPYPNECYARCNGATRITEGACRCRCPRHYDPVCSDGTMYANKCMARCAGAWRLTRAASLGCTTKLLCRCSSSAGAIKPVCGDGQTYASRCEANCNGARFIFEGRCACDCPAVDKPVCLTGETYPNECEARCGRAPDLVVTPGVCPTVPGTLGAASSSATAREKSEDRVLCALGLRDIIPGFCKDLW